MAKPFLHKMKRFFRSLGFRLRFKRFVTSPLHWFGGSLPSFLPFYLLVLVGGYAAYHGWPRETVISSFQMPPASSGKVLPFGGETVASTLLDALTAIRQEAEAQPVPPPCDMHAAEHQYFGGLNVTPNGAFQVSGPFSVEVKGLSVGALGSEAREVLGHERSISGDLLLDGSDMFQLTARANDAGPWAAASQELSVEGLKKASCDLAEQILGSTDKNLLAAALIRRRNYKRVIELYQTIPDEANLAEALNNLGVALRETGHVTDSIIKLHQALEILPEFPQAHYNLGVALLRNNGPQSDMNQAMVEYLEALRLKPNYPEARYNIGTIFDSEKDWDAGISEYREAERLQSALPEPHNNICYDLELTGSWDSAEKECREALRLNPNFPEAHDNLGAALDHRGDTDGAILEYREALRLNPELPEAHQNMSNALHDMGKLKEATAECKKAGELKKDLPKSRWCAGP